MPPGAPPAAGGGPVVLVEVDKMESLNAGRMPPELESITPQHVDFEPGKEIVLSGRSLDGKPLAVQVGKSETEPTKTGPAGLTFHLPGNVPAGVHPVRAMLGPKGGTRLDSNSLPLVVKPRIVGDPQMIDRSSGTVSKKVAMVNISPNVQAGQKVELLLNSLPKASRQAPAYRLRAEPSDKARSLVEVPITEVEKGKYLIRVEVDGATSALTQAEDGTFEGPQWEVK